MTCAMYKFTAAWHNMHLKWVCKCTACKAGSFHSYVYLFLCKIHKCFYPFVLLCLFKPSPNTIMLRPDFCKHLGKLKFTKHIFLPFNDSFKIIFEINHYYGEKGIPSIDTVHPAGLMQDSATTSCPELDRHALRRQYQAGNRSYIVLRKTIVPL